MAEAGGTIDHPIWRAALAGGAVLVICILSLLALLAALICAPPLKQMAERARDQAP